MAFTEEEKSCIHTVVIETLINEDNREITNDKVFCPSMKELYYNGFDTDSSRIASGTEYYGGYEYFIRTIKDYCGYDLPVFANGNGEFYKNVPNYDRGIRPCIKIDYSNAITVEKNKEQAKVKNLQKAIINLSKTDYKYDGKTKTPSVTVQYDGKELAVSEYSVEYKNNKYVGTASVVVTGKGNYCGSITKTFTIKSPGKRKVIFNANGGTVTTKSKSYSIGKKYNSLPSPKRKGYEFSGWYTVGDFMSCHQTAHTSCHWIAPFSGNGNL